MYEKNPLTKLCFLKKSLVSVTCSDPTNLCLQILRMSISEGGKSLVWASDSFTLIWTISKQRNFFIYFFQKIDMSGSEP